MTLRRITLALGHQEFVLLAASVRIAREHERDATWRATFARLVNRLEDAYESAYGAGAEVAPGEAGDEPGGVGTEDRA